MDSRTTQGTSRASMIILATVVFPEALPPPRPAGGGAVRASLPGGSLGGQRQDSPFQPTHQPPPRPDV